MSTSLSGTVQKRIRGMWGQTTEPLVIDDEEIPDFYITPVPFSLSDEAVILIGYSKIAINKGTPFHFFTNPQNFIAFLSNIKHVQSGKYAVILKFGEHQVPIYLHKKNGILSWFMCDSVPKAERTNFIKSQIEQACTHTRGAISTVLQQKDGFSCPIFALNALSHMVVLDSQGKLFPAVESIQSKTVSSLGVGELPPVLLKLAQVSKQTIVEAYKDSVSSINKAGDTISQSLGGLLQGCCNTLSTQKAEKYKHHVETLLKSRTNTQIQHIITSVTSTELRRLYQSTGGLTNRHGSNGLYNPYKPALLLS